MLVLFVRPAWPVARFSFLSLVLAYGVKVP